MKFVKCLVCKKKIKIPGWYNIPKAWCVTWLVSGSVVCGWSDLDNRYGRFVVCSCGGATCLCKDYKRVKKMLEKLKG